MSQSGPVSLSMSSSLHEAPGHPISRSAASHLILSRTHAGKEYPEFAFLIVTAVARWQWVLKWPQTPSPSSCPGHGTSRHVKYLPFSLCARRRIRAVGLARPQAS